MSVVVTCVAGAESYGVVMSLAGVAKETLQIVHDGVYVVGAGDGQRVVDVKDAVRAALAGTVLYRPAPLDALVAQLTTSPTHAPPPQMSTTPETTAQAGRRLVEEEGIADVAVLNFASAKNPGGGFLGGAKAQEEDLARCSALYDCLRTQRAYYDVHRADAAAGPPSSALLYTDHIIYSPRVPFFRDHQLQRVAPYALTVLTSAAPNAGQLLRVDPTSAPVVQNTLRRRAGKVLAVAASRGHRTLVLGAWGCGVFMNDPVVVAAAFDDWLRGPFASSFDRVVFAVFDKKKHQPTLAAFTARFG